MPSTDVRSLPVLPHSLHAEQAVLGAILIDAEAWPIVAKNLSGSDFYQPRHQLVFAAMASLRTAGKAIDVMSVADWLERPGPQGMPGALGIVADLARNTPSSVNLETYLRTVRDRAGLRRLVELADRLSKDARQNAQASPQELVSATIERLLDLQRQSRVGGGLVPSAELVSQALEDLDRRQEGHRGLELGLSDFDEITTGLEPGDLGVIAGRPGMGKTALLVQSAVNVSCHSDVAIFSAEMPAAQLMRRAFSLLPRVPQGRLRQAQAMSDSDWGEITKAAALLAEKRLHIDDTPSPSLAHIRAELCALRTRADLGLVLIDYVQLVEGEGSNRYEQLRDVAYGLKRLAKDLSVPIIVLAQLNRSAESTDRPGLAMLRDSGAIEEAADLVGILWCASYYRRDFAMPNVLECSVEKNRHGERGQCLWQFDGATSMVRVLELAEREAYCRLIAESANAPSRSANKSGPPPGGRW